MPLTGGQMFETEFLWPCTRIPPPLRRRPYSLSGAIQLVRWYQPKNWNPYDPPLKMNELYHCLRERLGLDEETFLLAIYSALGSPLDKKGIDFFIEWLTPPPWSIRMSGIWSCHRVSVDLTVGAFKPNGYRADFLLRPLDLKEDWRFSSWIDRVARRLENGKSRAAFVSTEVMRQRVKRYRRCSLSTVRF